MAEMLTMISAGASDAEVEVTQAAMRRVGFNARVETSVRAQGEGIGIVILQTAIPTFLAPFLQPVAADSWKRLKRFFDELHDTPRGHEAKITQLYLRPEAVTGDQWEREGRPGRLPGFPPERLTQPELIMSNLMSDAAWEALAELDAAELAPGSYSWNAGCAEWRPSQG